MIFVTSWDDGSPFDLRLSTLMSKYGIRGNFYIPIFNSEGRSVLTTPDIRYLATGFDIGSHTYSHVYLDSVAGLQCEQEVVLGKKALEDCLGFPVEGFCYPGGRVTSEAKSIVKKSGFLHARTTVNLCSSGVHDDFLIPTSFQFYNHGHSVFFRNLISGGVGYSRLRMFSRLMRSKSLFEFIHYLLESECSNDFVFHLWGHSWEIDQFLGWHRLEEIFKFVSELRITTASVNDLYRLKKIPGRTYG